MEEKITLDSLIKEQENRINQCPLKQDSRYLSTVYIYDDMESYLNWLAKTKRFLKTKFSNDKDTEEFDRISKTELETEQQLRLLAILKALVVFPEPIIKKEVNNKEKEVNNKGINITASFNNSNSQSQNQSIAIDIFLEAIKDDLTGRQIKELKEAVSAVDNDLSKARPNIIEKLKSFGNDVVSNIVANILTNPTIWNGF